MDNVEISIVLEVELLPISAIIFGHLKMTTNNSMFIGKLLTGGLTYNSITKKYFACNREKHHIFFGNPSLNKCTELFNSQHPIPFQVGVPKSIFFSCFMVKEKFPTTRNIYLKTMSQSIF